MRFLLPHHLLFPLIWRLYCLGVGVGNKSHTWLLLVMNGLETVWPNLGFFINRLNRFNRFSTIAGCLCQPWRTPDLSLFGSHSSGLGIKNRFFCLFPYSVRNFLAKFGIFYQPSEPVGNRFNRFSTIAGCLCQPWVTPDLSLSGSHSSRLGIENRFFCLFPYSVRNFLAKFGIFYQPFEPVGNRFNFVDPYPVHRTGATHF